MQAAQRETVLVETRPGRGLNAATLEQMAHFARQDSCREDLRVVCETWLRDHRVPARDDVAELHALSELCRYRIPYRKDPVFRERLKAPRITLALGGYERHAFIGEDCESIAPAVVACGLAMGHQPARFRAGLGRCPHEMRGRDCPHPAELRRQLYGGAPCCPDSEAHVHGQVWANRPRGQWVSLDPVAHPRPPGFTPELYFVRFYYVTGRPGALGSLEVASMNPPDIAAINALPVTDPTMRFVLGLNPIGDLGTMAAEMTEASGFQLERMPLGCVLHAPYGGAEGAGLVFLGAGALGGYYGDAGGGVWQEVPMAFGGFWSSIKSVAGKVKSAVGAGAKFFHKVAPSVAGIAALVPGLGTAAAAAIVAVDRAGQLAIEAAKKAEDLKAQAQRAVGNAKVLLGRSAAAAEQQAKAVMAQASAHLRALQLPPGVVAQVARVLPTTALVSEVNRAAATAAPAVVGRMSQVPRVVPQIFHAQRDGLRRLMRSAYGSAGCGCQLERVA